MELSFLKTKVLGYKSSMNRSHCTVTQHTMRKIIDVIFHKTYFFLMKLSVASWQGIKKAVRKLSENLLFVGKIFVQKFPSKITKFLAEKPSFWGSLGVKFKFWAPIISSVKNLELSVGILLEICGVCKKIATSCPTYFFNTRRCYKLYFCLYLFSYLA